MVVLAAELNGGETVFQGDPATPATATSSKTPQQRTRSCEPEHGPVGLGSSIVCLFTSRTWKALARKPSSSVISSPTRGQLNNAVAFADPWAIMAGLVVVSFNGSNRQACSPQRVQLSVQQQQDITVFHKLVAKCAMEHWRQATARSRCRCRHN